MTLSFTCFTDLCALETEQRCISQDAHLEAPLHIHTFAPLDPNRRVHTNEPPPCPVPTSPATKTRGKYQHVNTDRSAKRPSDKSLSNTKE